MKTTGSDLLPIDHRILWGPDPSQAAPGMFDDLDVPSQLCLDPLVETFLLVSAVGPEQLETGKTALERRKYAFAAAVVLDVGLMNQNVQDQPSAIDQQVAFASLDLLPAILAARPPFCVVFTD